MYWMPQLYGYVPSGCNICGQRWQMRNRSVKVYFMRNMRINLSGWCNRTRIKQPPPERGAFYVYKRSKNTLFIALNVIL